MSGNDLEYYRRRAAAETEMAFQATDEVAAKLHAELALHYQRKLDQATEQASRGVVLPMRDQASRRPKLSMAWNGMGRAR